MKPKVFFDWDDIFWSSGYKVADELGIERERWIDFHINENELLSETEREQVNRLLMLTETYQGMKLFPGIEEILELWKEDADFFINSNCYSEEVVVAKRQQIPVFLPVLSKKNLRLNLVVPNVTTKKPIDNDAYILVDDNPYNILNSPAKINIVPRFPWNTTKKAIELMRDKNVRYIESCDLGVLAREVRKALSEQR